MEKKAEIRKLPFCPASRQETGFFVPGRTGDGGRVAGRERGKCGEIPLQIAFPGRLRRKIPGWGMVCVRFSVHFPEPVTGCCAVWKGRDP